MDRWMLITLGILIVTGVAIVLGERGGEPSEPETVLRAAGIVAPATNYSVTMYRTSRVSDLRMERVRGRNEGSVLEATILSPAGPAFAQAYLEDQRDQIMSAYLPEPSPYAGIPSTNRDCPERLRPDTAHTVRGGVNYTYYRLYADAERDIGVCSDDATRYRATILTVYCPSADAVFVVRVFQPVEEAASGVIDALRCR